MPSHYCHSYRWMQVLCRSAQPDSHSTRRITFLLTTSCQTTSLPPIISQLVSTEVLLLYKTLHTVPDDTHTFVAALNGFAQLCLNHLTNKSQLNMQNMCNCHYSNQSVFYLTRLTETEKLFDLAQESTTTVVKQFKQVHNHTQKQ